MADAARNITIKVLLDEAKARMGLKQLGDDAETTGSRWSNMGALAKAGLAVAAGAVVGFLKDATAAALEDERAQRDLALALENTTGATVEDIKKTEEWIDATARATGVADDQLRPALETLTRATGDLDEAQGLLTTAMDISAATGKPLQTVVEAIGKSINTQTVGPMGRLGLKTKDAAGNMLTLDEVLQDAQRTMGGAMAAAAETGAGSMARLQVAFDETKEEIGTAFIPILIEAADKVMEIFEAFERPIDTSKLDAVGQTAVRVSEETNPLLDSFQALGEMVGLNTEPAVGELLRTMDDGRGSQADFRAATDDVATAEEELAGAIRDTITVRQEANDQMRAQIDPFFALVDATNDQAEAQRDLNILEAEGVTGGLAYEDALRRVADTSLDVEDAQLKLLDSGGLTREEFEKQRIKMGLTADQAQYLIDKYDLIFTPRTVTHMVNYDERTAQTRGRQAGGPVTKGTAYTVGEAGPETFVPNTSGRIIPHSGRSRGGTPNVNHITINAGMGTDPNAISRALVEALQRYERANGPLPVHTR